MKVKLSKEQKEQFEAAKAEMAAARAARRKAAKEPRTVEMPSGAVRGVKQVGFYTPAEKRAIAKVRKMYPGMARGRALAIARQGLI
jgi:hypothetical protein